MNRMIFFEFVLILSSVFIFRSLWVWLDQCPWMHTNLGLGASLLFGVIATYWALSSIHRSMKKEA